MILYAKLLQSRTETRQSNMTLNNINKKLPMVKQLRELVFFFLNRLKVIIQAGDLRPNALDAVEIDNYCQVFYCHFLVSNVVQKIILYLNRCHRLLAIVPRNSGQFFLELIFPIIHVRFPAFLRNSIFGIE